MLAPHRKSHVTTTLTIPHADVVDVIMLEIVDKPFDKAIRHIHFH